MAKTWVLDTDTKGTGARMVPLEQALDPLRSERDLAVVELPRPPRPKQLPGAPAPLRFKLVDTLSSRVLVEHVGAREAIELLEGANSMLDVAVYIRTAPLDRWRMLSLEDRKILWGFRGRLRASPHAGD